MNATPGRASLAALTAVESGWLDGTILLDAANAATADGLLSAHALWDSPEYVEGVAAFLEKRPPSWASAEPDAG